MIQSVMKSSFRAISAHRHLLLLVVVIQLVSSHVMAQVISRNANEDVVVTYKDGSWRYFIASDSVLLFEEYQNFMFREKQAAMPVIVKEESIFTTPQKVLEESTIANKVTESAQEPDMLAPEVQEQNELQKLELKERRLTLTERIRRVESGYIQLTEKDLKKIRDELDEINATLASLEPSINELEEGQLIDLGYRRSDFAFDVNVKTDLKDQCNVIKKYDEFTARNLAQVEPQFFFHYTPEEMRSHLKSGHYLEANVSVKQSNGITNLLISFVVNSRNAKRDFGILEEKAQLRVKFINGQTLILFNTIRDVGRLIPDKNQFVYTGRYVLDANAIKNFEKDGIDTIRVSWSVGYEDYNIYFVDVIKEQLACLFKAL